MLRQGTKTCPETLSGYHVLDKSICIWCGKKEKSQVKKTSFSKNILPYKK